LAQVRQKRGETVAEYIQRFRKVNNRCYSTRISEKRGSRTGIFGIGKTDQGSGFPAGVQFFGASGTKDDGIRETSPRMLKTPKILEMTRR
jgi:hypothetical protein